VLFLLRKNHS
jgi:hypothetical protein